MTTKPLLVASNVVSTPLTSVLLLLKFEPVVTEPEVVSFSTPAVVSRSISDGL